MGRLVDFPASLVMIDLKEGLYLVINIHVIKNCVVKVAFFKMKNKASYIFSK